MNSRSKAFAERRARVVLPTPGGPHKIIECGLPEANARLSGLPAANKWVWPITSSIVFGRKASANGGGGVLSKRPLIDQSCLDKENHNGRPGQAGGGSIRQAIANRHKGNPRSFIRKIILISILIDIALNN